MGDHNPTMFCHDGTTIFYPTRPGQVHMITIAALYDCDGSDEDYSDSTSIGDLSDMIRFEHSFDTWTFGPSPDIDRTPSAWPPVYVGHEVEDSEATAIDFSECVEQWADWCDRDAERIDALDRVKAA